MGLLTEKTKGVTQMELHEIKHFLEDTRQKVDSFRGSL